MTPKTYDVEIEINGETHRLSVQPHHTLLQVLRNTLRHGDVRRGCDYGGCGACTVIMNGKAIYSCMMPAIRSDGKSVLTVQGLVKNGQLDPLQESFIKVGAIQCGYCTSGMIMSAKALLDEKPSPSEEDIREALAGNLCRCTGYVQIVKAIKELSPSMAK